ncbi:MAG: ferredoxin [Patescibacteria group bacterium]
MEFNQIKLDKATCIGCGTCAVLAPKTFQMEDDGKAGVINPPGDDEATIKSAADACPVAAIILA